MFSIKEHPTPSRKNLRSFGWILAAGFGVIGFAPVVFRHHSPNRWAIFVSLVFGVAAVVAPSALRQVYGVWMTLGNILAWINSRIILGAVYYMMFTPARLVLKISGRDPMNRDFDRNAETYRVIREPRPASHMKHQF